MIPETSTLLVARVAAPACQCSDFSLGFRVTALRPCALASWAGPCDGIRCYYPSLPSGPVWSMAKESELAPLDVGGSDALCGARRTAGWAGVEGADPAGPASARGRVAGFSFSKVH